MARLQITPGNAPVKWSSIDQAFADINLNFNELYDLVSLATNPESLPSTIAPNINDAYDIGFNDSRWRSLYLTNSIFLNANEISSNVEGGVDLPEGSTVNGTLIDTGPILRFTSINIVDQGSIVAASESDSFTLSPGVGTFITQTPGNVINISLDQGTDIYASVYSRDNNLLVDSENEKLVGSINSDDGVSTISMDGSKIQISSTGSVEIFGKSSSEVFIGADLFLGGEANHVRVSDVSKRVTIKATSFSNDESTWTFDPLLTGEGTVPAKITFPDGTEQRTAWAGGRVVTVPTTSLGAEGDQQGDLAFNGSYIYYCTADYTDGLTNIWKRVAWSADTW